MFSEDKIKYSLSNQKFMKKIPDYTHRSYFKSNVCGDTNEIYLKVSSSGIVEDIGYLQVGCGFNIALLEVFCSKLISREVEIINDVLEEVLILFSQAPNQKQHCQELFINSIKLISEKKN